MTCLRQLTSCAFVQNSHAFLEDAEKKVNEMKLASDLEARGRELLGGHSYSEAAQQLRESADIDGSRKDRIASEFGFLFYLLEATSGDPEIRRSQLRWITQLWRVWRPRATFCCQKPQRLPGAPRPRQRSRENGCNSESSSKG